MAVALGPVVAITPYEVSSSILGGFVFNPALSGRGEAAGVHDEEVSTNGWVFLDTPGPDPMSLQGSGITVSGNSCMSLSVFQDFQVPAFAPSALQVIEYVFLVNDRCRNIVNREVYRTTFPYNGQNQMALSFTGRFAAVVVPTDFEGAEAVLRIDTETLALAQMPLPGGYVNFVGRLGVDISDDGNVDRGDRVRVHRGIVCHPVRRRRRLGRRRRRIEHRDGGRHRQLRLPVDVR